MRDASGAKLDSITVAEAEALIADGTISGGMVPKVKAALAALAWDDAEAIIADSSAEQRARAGARGPDVRDPRLGARPRRRRLSGPTMLVVKRDRHAAIRRLVAEHPIGSQGELVAELSALGFDVTQATVSRDIAELGLAKVMRGDRSVYVNPEALGAGAPSASDERLRRILADIPVTVGRSGLILVLTGQPGTASVIAQAIDESTLTEQVGTVAGDNTLIVLFPDEPALERWLARFDAHPRAGGRGGDLHGGPVPMKKVVLAYSGGLDTSVAVAWLKEQYGAEVVTLTVDLGGGSIREGVERRAMSAGASKAYVVDAKETFVSQYVWRALQANAVYQGAYPAGHRPRPAAARPAPRRGRPARGCGRRRARLHRQGQRPGPLRRRRPRARSRGSRSWRRCASAWA